MNVIAKIVITLIISFVMTEMKAQENYGITVVVNEADNNDGKIGIALYDTKDEFLDVIFKETKSEITNNTYTVTFDDITSGTYAVSIFHDENDNGKMDSDFMGIPKEDYGCSNDASGFIRPPKQEDAKFYLKENKSITP
jgi:uncharacterized protein (DUF2141 family)